MEECSRRKLFMSLANAIWDLSEVPCAFRGLCCAVLCCGAAKQIKAKQKTFSLVSLGPVAARKDAFFCFRTVR